MAFYTDQIGHRLEVTSQPQRIISVVPSQTELLHYLGLDERVVGITKFCVHPENWFHSKTRIGGTKTLNFEKIVTLQPDLIIANKEENTEEEIKQLQQLYPVWTSDIYTLEDNFAMIEQVSELTDTKQAAQQLIAETKAAFETLPESSALKTALYLIWNNPIMCAGEQTYIGDMLKRCGLTNALPLKEKYTRYPELTEADLMEMAPDCILLSSEPFPFKQAHIDKFKALCPRSEVILVDGEMFSWYGSRARLAPLVFREILSHLR